MPERVRTGTPATRLSDADNLATRAEPCDASGTRTICTHGDAGADAWGIVCDGLAIGGYWEPHQRSWSPGARELYPLLQLYLRNPESLRGAFVVHVLDNAGDVLSIDHGRAATRMERHLLSALYACMDDLRVEFVAWWNSRRVNAGPDSLSKCTSAVDARRWAVARGLQLRIVSPGSVRIDYALGSLAATAGSGFGVPGSAAPTLTDRTHR